MMALKLATVTVTLPGGRRVAVDLPREALRGNKLATRRLVRLGRPCKYAVGRCYALVRAEWPNAVLAVVRITAAWSEPLSAVDANPGAPAEEGLPWGSTPTTLRRLLCAIYGLPMRADPQVWVVCFRLVPGTSRLRLVRGPSGRNLQ